MKHTTITLLAVMASAVASAWAYEVPRPGTINYLEGKAALAGTALPENVNGTARIEAGQTLTTEAGRAEVLLTPGIFIRVADHSVLEMVSPQLANTVVTLRQGRALVEVAAILPANRVAVNEGGISIRFLKPGLYDFDAARGVVRVFDGKVEVEQKAVGGGHMIANLGGKLKVARFEKSAFEDEFYRWASLRDSYVTDANVDAARGFAQQPVASSGGWGGGGWYWDSGFDAYTFIPGDGIFYSPFGWGFYSPWSVWGAPAFGYWRGGGYYGGHHHFGPGYAPHPFAMTGGTGHAGFVRGSQSAVGRVGVGARSYGGGLGRSGGFGGGGGGFHGGGGGFHGGGGGGFGGGHGGGGGHR